MQRVLTTVTLLGLLVATAAAFVITEHLKLIKSPVYGTEVSKVFSPVCRCATDRATIAIKLRKRERVTVTIVDSKHDTVATVVSDQSFPRTPPRGAAYTFPWDGRTASGAVAPDGVYYPWIHLSSEGHTLSLPNRIVLDTALPKVLSARGGKAVLLAGPGKSIAIKYAFSEPAHPVLYLGDRRLVVGRRTRPESKVKWAGTIDGSAVRQGRYVLSIGAQDLAGNETPSSARKHVTVVVRYIDVSPGRISVRAGARLTAHVETAARRYTWRLGRRHGSRRGRVLRLDAPTTPGTYHLVVTEDGHSAAAAVQVRAK